MATYLDISSTLDNIEIGATGIKEIVQNVKIILTTIKGSVPLDRDFGIDPGFIDAPIRTARALFASKMVAAVKKYEPRVEVVKLLWTVTDEDAMAGRVTPVVRIRIKDGVKIE